MESCLHDAAPLPEHTVRRETPDGGQAAVTLYPVFPGHRHPLSRCPCRLLSLRTRRPGGAGDQPLPGGAHGVPPGEPVFLSGPGGPVRGPAGRAAHPGRLSHRPLPRHHRYRGPGAGAPVPVLLFRGRGGAARRPGGKILRRRGVFCRPVLPAGGARVFGAVSGAGGPAPGVSEGEDPGAAAVPQHLRGARPAPGGCAGPFPGTGVPGPERRRTICWPTPRAR